MTHAGGAEPAAPLFRGAGVALLTLFDRDGALLVDQTAAFAATLAEEGAAAVLVAGTTGEFWTMEIEERLSLVAAVRAAVPASVPVIGGIGAIQAGRALELAGRVGDTGADAALCFVPRDATPQPFYSQVRDAVGDLELLAYHFPAVGYVPLEVASLADLPVDGIKDSSGDPARLLPTARLLRRGVYSGSALLCSLACAVGADGVLLALSNADPRLSAAAAAGSLAAQGDLAALHATITGGTPPTALKEHVATRYGTPPWTRGIALSDAT